MVASPYISKNAKKMIPLPDTALIDLPNIVKKKEINACKFLLSKNVASPPHSYNSIAGLSSTSFHLSLKERTSVVGLIISIVCSYIAAILANGQD